VFQSTPPYGGATCSCMGFWTMSPLFQSTPPYGGRLTERTKDPDLKVSIHAPVWGATPLRRQWRSDPKFQSTPPYGGRRDITSDDIGETRFNPRPRMGGDPQGGVFKSGRNVSIHAPVWGATSVRGIRGAEALVSIHAPVWGGDHRQHTEIVTRTSFNPRPRMGGDLTFLRISSRTSWFQSTPPYGGRLVL